MIHAENITDRRIKQEFDRILADKTPCRLSGDVANIAARLRLLTSLHHPHCVLGQ